MRLGGLKKTGAQLIPTQAPAKNLEYITEVDLFSKAKSEANSHNLISEEKNKPTLYSLQLYFSQYQKISSPNKEPRSTGSRLWKCANFIFLGRHRFNRRFKNAKIEHLRVLAEQPNDEIKELE